VELKVILSILSFVFFILTVTHIINYRHRFNLEFQGKIAKINGISLGTAEFSKDLKIFVDNLNKSQKFMNLIAIVGYSASFLTTLISLIILLHTK